MSSFAIAQVANAGLAEKYAEEGQNALAAGRYADAQTAFEKLRQLEPNIAEIHANLGLIYFQQRNFEQAVASLRQALKLKPTLSKSDSLLAISLSEMGRFKESLPGLERGFRRTTDPEMRRMCGLQLQRAYTGMGNDAKAVETALELNKLYPDDPEILYQTGKIYGNFAYLTMQKLWHVGPDSIWRHQAAAEAYESQGSYDLAVTEYRAVLAVDPRRPGIHYRIGRTLLSQKREQNSSTGDEAGKEFEQELEIDPGNANAAYELGEMNRKAGQLDTAGELFVRALKSYPDFEEAHLALGTVLTAQNKPDQALPHLQRAVGLNPENEVSWYRLSLLYRSLGNTTEQQKALAEFKRLHEKASQQNLTKDIFSPKEVTRQELDANPSQ